MTVRLNLLGFFYWEQEMIYLCLTVIVGSLPPQHRPCIIDPATSSYWAKSIFTILFPSHFRPWNLFVIKGNYYSNVSSHQIEPNDCVYQSSICSNKLQKQQALISDDNCPFWGDWSNSACSNKTCGDGELIFTRNCFRQNKKVDRELCRKEYPFNQEDKKIVSWGAWSECSKTCGTGERTRSRECPSNFCSGESSQNEKCHKEYCVKWTGIMKSFL